MNYTLNVPINSVSFGQCSMMLLRELFNKNINPCIFPIGQPDVTSQRIDQNFLNWLNVSINKSVSQHNRKNKTIKLWHLNGSMESFGENQNLITFYELDCPTEQELNIIRNNKTVIVTSHYTKNILEENGANNIKYVPLAFDKYNFNKKNKKYFNDERIVFNILGKFEKRKNHEKAIKAWIKKYGNNPEYFLQCAVFNPFLSNEENESIVRFLLDNKNYFNVQFLGFMPQNELYNDFINSADIVLGMSGAEGWGLGEFHSLAIGKHGVILNAHAHKEWANNENAVLVNPNGKEPAYDGKFFVQGQMFNQGNIFSFKEEDFIDGCEKAIARVKKSRINTAGLELQEKFTTEKFSANVLNSLE